MKSDLKYKIGTRVRYISQEFFADTCDRCGSSIERMTTEEEEDTIERVDVTYYANAEPVVTYFMVGSCRVVRESRIIEEVKL